MLDLDQASQTDVIKRFSQSAVYIPYRGERVLRFSIFPYLRANLPDMKLTPKAWQTELAALTVENEAEYAKLKVQREEVAELQKVRR